MNYQEEHRWVRPSPQREGVDRSPGEVRVVGSQGLPRLTPLMQQAILEGMEAFCIAFGKCLLKQMVKNLFG